MSKMFITPKTLPNGASLSMEQLLATLETPRPERKAKVEVISTDSNGYNKQRLVVDANTLTFAKASRPGKGGAKKNGLKTKKTNKKG